MIVLRIKYIDFVSLTVLVWNFVLREGRGLPGVGKWISDLRCVGVETRELCSFVSNVSL